MQGSKLTVTNVQIVTDLRLFAPKIFDLRAHLLLKFLKIIFACSKSFFSFLVVNLCIEGSLEVRKTTLFKESSNVADIPGILSYLSERLGQVFPSHNNDINNYSYIAIV